MCSSLKSLNIATSAIGLRQAVGRVLFLSRIQVSHGQAKERLHFFNGSVTQVGTRPSARSFLVIFTLSLVTVQEVFAKVNSSQFPSTIARSFQIASRRTSHPHVIFSSKRIIFLIVLFTIWRISLYRSNKQ